MLDIARKVEAFLQADGLQVQRKPDGLLYAEGRAKDGSRKQRWVWVGASRGVTPEFAQGFPDIIDRTLPIEVRERPQELQEQDPWAFLVVPTLKGISGNLSRQVKERGVTRNTLPQFFDTFYRSRNPVTDDSLQEFAALHSHLVRERVPHRFRHLSANQQQSAAASNDLLASLLAEYEELPSAVRVRVVTGGAGRGKTILFNALYSALYDRFQTYKRSASTEVYPRPLFFLPEALRKQRGYSLEAMLDAFFSTVGAAPVSPGLFNWLHREGHVLPMLDGMDEFFARQTDLFEQLSRNLEAPGSRAQLIFCVRDSLIGTNPLLTQFLERHESAIDPRRTEVYELEPWNAESRRTMAWLRLENELPGAGRDTERVKRFLTRIGASPDLTRLCELPLYCALLLERFTEGDGDLPADELDLLDMAILQLVDREHIKLVGREQEEELPVLEPIDPVAESDVFPFDDYISPEDRAEFATIRRQQYGSLFSVTEPALRNLKELAEVRNELGKQGVINLLEQVAHVYRRQTDAEGTIRGIQVDALASLLDHHRGERQEGERGFRALLILKQFAVFNAAGKANTVDFAHEVMADYLAAGHAAEILRSNPAACAEAFGELTVDRDSVFHKRLRKEVAVDQSLAKGLSDALAQHDIAEPYIPYVRAILK